MQTGFGIAALGLSITANIPYIIETLQGKVKPERVSWFIWTLLGVVYFWSALVENGATLFTVGELVGPVVAFLLSFKFGVGGKSRLDVAMLVLALIAIGFLVSTKGTLLGLLFALCADGIAMILTIKKLHVDPTTESRWAWGIFAASAICGLLSLNVFTVETLLFPVYVLVSSVYITFRARPSLQHGSDIEKL